MTRQEQSRLYYERNREAIKARVRAYAQAHPEVRRVYISKNRAKINSINRAWCARNNEQWKRISKAANAKYKARLKAEFIEAYGGKCECCGITEPAFLTLDHIGGGGNAERKMLGWRGLGVDFYTRLKKLGWPKDRYRLFCMNCNFATKHGKSCPHTLIESTLHVVEGLVC